MHILTNDIINNNKWKNFKLFFFLRNVTLWYPSYACPRMVSVSFIYIYIYIYIYLIILYYYIFNIWKPLPLKYMENTDFFLNNQRKGSILLSFLICGMDCKYKHNMIILGALNNKNKCQSSLTAAMKRRQQYDNNPCGLYWRWCYQWNWTGFSYQTGAYCIRKGVTLV